MTNSTSVQKKRGRKKKVNNNKAGRRKGKGVRISAFLLDIRKYSRLRLGQLITEIPDTPVLPQQYLGRRVLYQGEEEGGVVLNSDIDYLELHMVQGWFGDEMRGISEVKGGVFSLERYDSMV